MAQNSAPERAGSCKHAEAELLQARWQCGDLHVERGQRLAGALRANIVTETERRRRVKAAKHQAIRAVGHYAEKFAGLAEDESSATTSGRSTKNS